MTRRGIILMEVVLSLAIFVSAAAVVHSAMVWSLRAVNRNELKCRAVDLAVSKMAMLQVHPNDIIAEGPTEFDTEDDESLAGWYYKIEVESNDTLEQNVILQRVTVTITRPESRIFYRLTQLLPPAGETTEEEEEE